MLREGAGVEGGRGCCGRGWGRVLREGVEGGVGCQCSANIGPTLVTYTNANVLAAELCQHWPNATLPSGYQFHRNTLE